ncbi:ankyrin repeat domain-containing protein [Dactylosporangium sp. CA-233914]|uniref:ankyrin repeat domain-containing protein n=1 Tax=Dactylosporangium sp. CA-233914 TaxID=3239934 RepID=UPI003D93088F
MSALIGEEALGNWRRVRQYAVPRRMIERATAARLAGDWRAACAAAGVVVEPGEAELAPFADDLLHFAPDLLRWHLPRRPGRGETTIAPRNLVILARRGDSLLGVGTPRVGFGSQRLVLVACEEIDEDRFPGSYDWSAARHRWDAREADRLAERTCGPNATQILALQDAGQTQQAWADAGIDVPDPPDAARKDFARFDADPHRVLAAARAGRTATFSVTVSGRFDLRLHLVNGGPVHSEWVRARSWTRPASPDRLDYLAVQRPVDLHLVRTGLLSPADLHPLVGPQLAPFAAAARIPVVRRDDVVRVRCGGQWHAVGWESARLAIPHDADERRREEALRALGGTLHGCFAAAEGWADRADRLPRRLEEQRRDLLLRMMHGDLDGVVERLDAGMDPRARDVHGRTLLHLIAGVDWCEGWPDLLARLLAAGLDLEARDHAGRTPLHLAVHQDGSPQVVGALLDAGADPHAEDAQGWSLADLYDRRRADDLPQLRGFFS